ncbi:hypothetical protein ACS0TY_014204 [Phlomoides rotata]
MEQLINFIIRPPRAEYNPKNDLLDQEFMLKSKWYQRKDLEVVNSRGDVLQCSHYVPIISPEGKALPCVIYCHGNSGCRTDASEAAVILLPSNITVFTLDFSGSGLSGGDHVTLGWNEKDDLRAVVDYLRSDGNVSLIGLWGRSMGAVTSLMYGAEDPSIAGMVLDSPFSDLVDLMMELVDTYKVRLPKFTVKFAIQYMRRAIQKKAKFDITELNTIKGDKNIIKFEGDHNSPRPQFYFDSISIFFNNVLQPPEDVGASTYFDLSNSYVSKGRWSTVHDVEFSDELLGSPSGTAASSTEDAIKQLRSKRPMSAMVVPADISSKDNQPNSEVESRESDSQPSSSNMISFDLSNSSNVPGSVDDDEYVEYSLDMLADFPNNVEEEERMVMVAILKSLKDSEPPVEEPSSNAVGCSSVVPKLEPAPKNEDDHFFSCSNSLKTETVSPSPENEHKPASNGLAPDSSHHTTNVEGEASQTTSPSDNARSSSDVDMADRTKVTVEVEKNPTTNIIDGLLRRWDFFRNR